jgi:hypothetical protein
MVDSPVRAAGNGSGYSAVVILLWAQSLCHGWWCDISIMKPTCCTFHSIYWESRASTCFELSLRRHCTNSTWYIACVLCRLCHDCSFTESRASTCFELNLRRHCTNSTWYIACVLCWLCHDCSFTESRASTCFEQYLLILRRRFTNCTWYYVLCACNITWLCHDYNETAIVAQPTGIT